VEGVGNPRVALFFRAVRGASLDQLEELFEAVMAEARGVGAVGSKERAQVVADLVVLTLQTRDIRGGKGERDVFRSLLLCLHRRLPQTASSMLKLLTEASFGSFKDLLQLVEYLDVSPDKFTEDEVAGLRSSAVGVLVDALRQDQAKLAASSSRPVGDAHCRAGLSLAGKWAPREGRHYSKLAREVALLLFPGAKDARAQYRKLVAALNRQLATVEVAMCGGSWDEIEPGAVPSRCLRNNKWAFMNTPKGRRGQHERTQPSEDERRAKCAKIFEEHAEAALDNRPGKKRKTMHGAALQPHELVREYLGRAATRTWLPPYVPTRGSDSVPFSPCRSPESPLSSDDGGGRAAIRTRLPPHVPTGGSVYVPTSPCLSPESPLASDDAGGRAAIRTRLPPHVPTSGSVYVLTSPCFSPESPRPAASDDAGGKNNITEAQWLDLRDSLRESLTKRVDGGGGLGMMVPVVDVSGSMAGQPMEVAISLGLLVAELTHPAFRDRMLTFEETPRWHDLPPAATSSLFERVASAEGAPWGGSTNFVAAMELVLEECKKRSLSAQDVAKLTLVVFSDMQFDVASYGSRNWYGEKMSDLPRWDETHYERLRRRFMEAGFSGVPTVVFWNLRGDTDNYPADASTPGVVMLGGFSPNMFKLFCEGDTETLVEEAVQARLRPEERANAYQTLREVLDDERYRPVRELCARLGEGDLAGNVAPPVLDWKVL
jgi:hypothetical protein